MQALPSHTRRDPRYLLRDDYAFVEFPAPHEPARRITAVLTRISAAGVSFETTEPCDALHPGAVFTDVTLRIGDCVLRGGITLRNVHAAEDGRSACGGMFCPESPEVEDRLMTLITGIEAVAAVTEDAG